MVSTLANRIGADGPVAFALITLLVLGCNPTVPGGASPSGAPTQPGSTPGSLGDSPIMLELGGQTVPLPNVAVCLVTSERVEISASAASRTAGLTLTWSADAPPAETTISWNDVGVATYVAGPDVSANDPPRVTVTGDAVEIVATLYDPVLGQPPQPARITARCPEGSADESVPPSDEPPGEPPAASGHATVSVASGDYEFSSPELCEVSANSVSVSFVEGADTFDMIASGTAGFTTLTLDGEQWVAGITGDPIAPTINGSNLTWSGTLRTFSGTESAATIVVECAV